MEQVTCYKTRDGLLFDSMESADLHEKKLEFREWYERERLYGRYETSGIDIELLEQWLLKNGDRVVSHIKALRTGYGKACQVDSRLQN